MIGFFLSYHRSWSIITFAKAFVQNIGISIRKIAHENISLVQIYKKIIYLLILRIKKLYHLE